MATPLDSATAEPPVTVTDLKNWVYCARVPFYTAFLAQRPTTFKMAAGQGGHVQVADLEERRSLRAYGLTEGERVFHVRLRSAQLGLSGLLDMAILTETAATPVEFKSTTGGVGLNHKVQLTAYALLVEERWERPVERGFIYLIPQRRAYSVPITDQLRQQVHAILGELRQSLRAEAKPPPTQQRAKCADCEFRRYCLDLG